MFNNENRVGDDMTTEDSPQIPVWSREMRKVVSVGGLLMMATIAMMLLTVDTAIADATLQLFDFFLFAGVIVFGVFIGAGRYLGLMGVDTGNRFIAGVGSVLCILAYGVFGGAILTPYSPSIYIPVLAITGGITSLITLVAGMYVYSTPKEDLSYWKKISGGFFMVGIVAALIGSFISSVSIIAFICFLFGFLTELVYEIWLTSNSERTPTANGIALYIAFAGVFVHILQMVARAYADR